MGAFYANRDYVAKVLCINRDKPEMKCKGACQLKKQLEKDNENQSKSNLEKNFKEVIVYFQNTCYPVPIHNEFKWTDRKYHHFFTTYLPEGHSRSVFHPPAAIV